jgi:hypothetical protein
MKPPSNSDDEELVTFLKQHRPSAPLASSDLEDNIMGAIAQLKSPQQQSSVWCQRWFIPVVIVTGVVAWMSYSLTGPRQPTVAELAQLQHFMESSWDSVDSPDESIWP